MIKIGEKKFSASAYAAFLVGILIIIVVIFSMYKYHVEGESKPPFIISKIIVTSSAKTVDIAQKDEDYVANILQNNDIKIAIQKNPEYKKEAKIKKLVINNIQITETNNASQIAVYRPSKGINPYDYQEQYVVKENMEYFGSSKTDLKGDNLQISNQGGIVELSVAQHNLGEITYKENEQISIDGTLIKKLNMESEDIAFKLTFDMIIELEGNLKLKTTITMDLPKGNIMENGIELYEHKDFKSVFKRI